MVLLADDLAVGFDLAAAVLLGAFTAAVFVAVFLALVVFVLVVVDLLSAALLSAVLAAGAFTFVLFGLAGAVFDVLAVDFDLVVVDLLAAALVLAAGALVLAAGAWAGVFFVDLLVAFFSGISEPHFFIRPIIVFKLFNLSVHFSK